MEKKIIDLAQLQAEMDAEDAELMAMFPKRRESVINEMILIDNGGELSILRKADIARTKKAMEDAALFLAGMTCASVCIAMLLGMLTGKIGMNTGFTIIELALAPFAWYGAAKLLRK